LYGSIIGTIEDPSGAVVPKAMITIANKQTGMTRDAVSDEAGRYSILNVLPGLYDLKVTAPGFRQMARTDIEVAVNTVTRENVKLEVGQTNEQVTVSASAVQLQTDKSDVRHDVWSKYSKALRDHGLL
jgi:hypothetical protein